MAQPGISPERAQEGVLQHVLGVVGPGDAAGVREQLVAVGLDQAPERGEGLHDRLRTGASLVTRRAATVGQPLPLERRAARPVPMALARCSAAFARADFWRRRPTKKSTPSTISTSRKPQKIDSAGSSPPNGSATS